MNTIMPERELTIRLRPMVIADLDDYLVWTTDDRVCKFLRRDPYTSKEAARAYLEDVIIPHPWYQAICLDGHVIGKISVTIGKESDGCRGSLGYGLAYQYWGKGIATIAVKMMLRTIFKEFPNLKRVEGLVDSENCASHRVLEKAGFVREGLLRKYMILRGSARDMVVYSFIAGDDVSE